jgi:hypothetical protein
VTDWSSGGSLGRSRRPGLPRLVIALVAFVGRPLPGLCLLSENRLAVELGPLHEFLAFRFGPILLGLLPGPFGTTFGLLANRLFGLVYLRDPLGREGLNPRLEDGLGRIVGRRQFATNSTAEGV